MKHLNITKEMAWAKRDDEVNIPIDYSVHDFKFSRNWFKLRNQTTFSTFLPKKFDGSKPIKMIQIGVFEGMDLIWNLQNTLKHPDSRVFAVDPWVGTTKLDDIWMEGCYERAIYNLQPWADKVTIARGPSQELLCYLGNAKREYNLIVIDGDHNAPAVYEDARLSLPLVKVGGWLLLDDYHNRIPKQNHVQEGVERFLDDYNSQVKLAWFHRHCVCFERTG